MTLPLPATDGCSGNQTYTVLPVCSGCSHGAYFHKLDGKIRTTCSVWNGSKCGCKVYEPKEGIRA